jgi:hypothetical protein
VLLMAARSTLDFAPPASPTPLRRPRNHNWTSSVLNCMLPYLSTQVCLLMHLILSLLLTTCAEWTQICDEKEGEKKNGEKTTKINSFDADMIILS